MQPELSLGVVGHIAHGKTTLVYALTKKLTLQHSEELKRGITIRLGYADCEFRYCERCSTYLTEKKCKKCKGETKLLRKVSFVDAPGHETLMATMLTGAAIIDGAILVIAANEPCPQPQTREHLIGLEVMGIKNVVIAQNKVDLVSEERAIESYNEIKEFVKGTIAEDAPIIPISAQHGANIDLLIQAIQERIPSPKREINRPPLMLVARSFDVNKPGADPCELVGGVIGGTLKAGKLRVGDEIEIRPGIKKGEEWEALITEIESLKCGEEELEEVLPGGNIGVATKLDPLLTKADSLAGSVAGSPNHMPPLHWEVELETRLLERVVGLEREMEVGKIEVGEILMLNAWTAKSIGIVKQMSREIARLELKMPICIEKGERIALSRRIGGRWRLIGYGTVK